MKPLAKPTGVLLEDHIRNLRNEAERILATRPFVITKYRKRTGEDFAVSLQQSADWHDEGKKHKKWQDACQKDFEEYQHTGKDQGKNLQRADIRHELASLEYMRRLNV